MASASRAPESELLEDGLFLDRLDAFCEKTLNDIKTFSQRERRSVEDIRGRMAKWYSKFLFPPRNDLMNASSELQRGKELATTVLHSVSQTLETLREISGKQSLLLVIDTNEPTDNGFIGGTPLGKDFWRGLRGGGASGLLSFKEQCLRASLSESAYARTNACAVSQDLALPSSSKQALTPSLAVRKEVYAAMRAALRAASGNHTAEMKWTNHSNVEERYRVRVAGWPADVPKQNPSSLSVEQNKRILDLIKAGTLHFTPLVPPPRQPKSQSGPVGPSPLDHGKRPLDGTDGDLYWAVADAIEGDLGAGSEEDGGSRKRKRIENAG